MHTFNAKESWLSYLALVKKYIENNLGVKLEINKGVLKVIVEHTRGKCPCRPVFYCPCPYLVHELKTMGRCKCGLFRVGK